MKLFNFCAPEKTKWFKFAILLSLAVGIPIVSDISKFVESKYIFFIFFGYMCNRVWGHDKPERELEVVLMFLQPI